MTRLHYALLAAIFLAGLLVSGYAMSSRAAAFNAASDKKLWAFAPVNLRQFKVGGHDVSLTDSTTADGSDVVILSFNGREIKLVPSVEPKDASLPGLLRHDDWLKVMRFAEFGRRSEEEFQAHLDAGNDRIAVVTRRPLTGPDPRTGDVWQRDWMFDFYELLPDGTIKTQGLRFPKTRGDKKPKPGELVLGTWEMEAALQLMPKTPPDSLAIGRPTAAFRTDAMRSLGWTLPVAALCVLGLLVCGALAAAPRRHRSATAK